MSSLTRIGFIAGSVLILTCAYQREIHRGTQNSLNLAQSVHSELYQENLPHLNYTRPRQHDSSPTSAPIGGGFQTPGENRAATEPADTAAPERVTTEPADKAPPQRVTTEPADKASPQRVTTEPADKASPKRVTAEPADKASPRRVTAEPADKAPPQRVTTEPADKASPKRVTAEPADETPANRRAATIRTSVHAVSNIDTATLMRDISLAALRVKQKPSPAKPNLASDAARLPAGTAKQVSSRDQQPTSGSATSTHPALSVSNSQSMMRSSPQRMQPVILSKHTEASIATASALAPKLELRPALPVPMSATELEAAKEKVKWHSDYKGRLSNLNQQIDMAAEHKWLTDETARSLKMHHATIVELDNALRKDGYTRADCDAMERKLNQFSYWLTEASNGRAVTMSASANTQ